MNEKSEASQETANSREREVAHARQVISTAKLVVTFSVAIAATFVATEMQVSDRTSWEVRSAIAMGVTLVLTFVVVALAPSPPKGELDDNELTRLRKWACWAHYLMATQVFFSALACFIAGVGLLRPDWK